MQIEEITLEDSFANIQNWAFKQSSSEILFYFPYQKEAKSKKSRTA